MSSAESFWSEIKAYEERLRQEPDSYCFAPLAEVYLRAGLLDDALETARAGVGRHPGYVAGQMALARVCHQKGLLEECRSALERVTAAVPENAEAQRMLARLYSEAGMSSKAARALQILLEFTPADIPARVELEALQHQVAEPEPDEDLELIEFTEDDIIEEEPEPLSPPPRATVMPADETGADGLVERIRPVVPSVGDPWSGLGHSAQPAQEVVQLSGPGSLSAEEPHPTLQDVWSLPETPAVPEKEPEQQDPLSTATLAELYVTQGFVDKAIAIYQDILSRHPDNREAARRLAELERRIADEQLAGQAAAAAAEQVPSPVELPVEGKADTSAVLSILEGWLENIRRLRTCR